MICFNFCIYIYRERDIYTRDLSILARTLKHIFVWKVIITKGHAAPTALVQDFTPPESAVSKDHHGPQQHKPLVQERGGAMIDMCYEQDT